MNNLKEYLAEQTEVNIFDYYPIGTRHVRHIIEELSGEGKSVFIKSPKVKGLYVRAEHSLRDDIDKYYRRLRNQRNSISKRMKALHPYVDDELKNELFGKFEGLEDD